MFELFSPDLSRENSTARSPSVATALRGLQISDFAGSSFREALIPWFHGDSAVVRAATKDLLANETG